MIFPFLSIEELNIAIKSPGLQKLKMKNSKRFMKKLRSIYDNKEEKG
jgi:hypothetical protein|tara:strand:- start:870 stop:1010 length:141 start_codon:yes stop_codon:yes gene_type:complete